MQQRRSVTGGLFGCMAMGLVLLTTSPTQAQTTANGPYYATPSWDQTLPAATRFIILSNFASAAVLDRETGLVWERSPQTTRSTWNEGREACIRRTTGNRMGWRLPSITELTSLFDPTQDPTLPLGHPFTDLQRNFYWSATTNADDPTFVWAALLHTDRSGIGAFGNKKTEMFQSWCVRGGMNADAY